ncbi:MAG: UvrD-helicase domain-containing protein, partial [Schleiferiaceae bacterium]|nr:UvrD-helicase domain-containing protein [Schleiferiaceae bacterium]
MPKLPLRQQPLSVFSASAGAGKTFRLAAEYIATALRDPNEPHAFAQILALTFTNKAAHEMKRRILDSLRDFSEVSDFGESKGLAQAVQDILNISGEELAIRARKALESMLHDYGSIGVGTLDQFTHRLVRTFALELGLPGQFDVELDQTMLLELAIQELMSEVGQNAELTQLLVSYAQSNVDDEKGGDLYPALLDMAKHLAQESSTEALRELAQWTMQHHGAAHSALHDFQRHLREQVGRAAGEIRDLLGQVNASDISYANRWLSFLETLEG